MANYNQQLEYKLRALAVMGELPDPEKNLLDYVRTMPKERAQRVLGDYLSEMENARKGRPEMGS